MLTRLLVPLLVVLGALAALAQELTPPAVPPPPPVTVVRVMVLQNLEVAALQPLLGMPLFTNTGIQGDFPFTPLAALVPKEIDSLLGMTQTNAILIRAKAPTLAAANAAVDSFIALVRMLDKPAPRIIIEVALIQTTYGEARAFGAGGAFASGNVALEYHNGGGEGNARLRYMNGQLRAAMSSMIVQEKAKVFSTAKVMVLQNGSGYISLAGTDLPLDTLAVRKASVLPNGQIILQIEPVYSLTGVYLNTPVVRAKDGEAVFLGMLGGPAITQTTVDPPGPLKLALPRRLTLSITDPVVLLLATPTVLPEELQDPFPVFKPLAPLF
jgi:hypothetical protein